MIIIIMSTDEVIVKAMIHPDLNLNKQNLKGIIFHQVLSVCLKLLNKASLSVLVSLKLSFDERIDLIGDY
jgi:hypothetical protein